MAKSQKSNLEMENNKTKELSKCKKILKNNFTISIQEMALAGIFVALWVISSRFITLDFGIMRAGIVYVWAILIGLTMKPFVGILIAIIADNISLAISNTGFSMWMIEYAIIYPGITLFASFFKITFKIKNQKIWWTIIIFINSLALGGAFLIAILKGDFVYHSKNDDANFDFSSNVSKITIWICMALMFIMFFMLVFIAIRKQKWKQYLAIYSLSAATIILFIWIWGPIAQVKYLIRLNGIQADGSSYWALYDVYLIARVLKTPIILPLYALIISSVYSAYQVLNIEQKNKYGW